MPRTAPCYSLHCTILAFTKFSAIRAKIAYESYAFESWKEFVQSINKRKKFWSTYGGKFKPVFYLSYDGCTTNI